MIKSVKQNSNTFNWFESTFGFITAGILLTGFFLVVALRHRDTMWMMGASGALLWLIIIGAIGTQYQSWLTCHTLTEYIRSIKKN